MRTIRIMMMVPLLLASVSMVVVLGACGVNWFPKCDDPKHPCPPVEPDYPPPTPFGAGHDAGDAGTTDARGDAR